MSSKRTRLNILKGLIVAKWAAVAAVLSWFLWWANGFPWLITFPIFLGIGLFVALTDPMEWKDWAILRFRYSAPPKRPPTKGGTLRTGEDRRTKS